MEVGVGKERVEEATEREVEGEMATKERRAEWEAVSVVMEVMEVTEVTEEAVMCNTPCNWCNSATARCRYNQVKATRNRKRTFHVFYMMIVRTYREEREAGEAGDAGDARAEARAVSTVETVATAGTVAEAPKGVVMEVTADRLLQQLKIPNHVLELHYLQCKCYEVALNYHLSHNNVGILNR